MAVDSGNVVVVSSFVKPVVEWCIESGLKAMFEFSDVSAVYSSSQAFDHWLHSGWAANAVGS